MSSIKPIGGNLQLEHQSTRTNKERIERLSSPSKESVILSSKQPESNKGTSNEAEEKMRLRAERMEKAKEKLEKKLEERQSKSEEKEQKDSESIRRVFDQVKLNTKKLEDIQGGIEKILSKSNHNKIESSLATPEKNTYQPIRSKPSLPKSPPEDQIQPKPTTAASPTKADPIDKVKSIFLSQNKYGPPPGQGVPKPLHASDALKDLRPPLRTYGPDSKYIDPSKDQAPLKTTQASQNEVQAQAVIDEPNPPAEKQEIQLNILKLVKLRPR